MRCLGPKGVQKQIFLGVRQRDLEIAYLNAFMELARNYREHPRKDEVSDIM